MDGRIQFHLPFLILTSSCHYQDPTSRLSVSQMTSHPWIMSWIRRATGQSEEDTGDLTRTHKVETGVDFCDGECVRIPESAGKLILPALIPPAPCGSITSAQFSASLPKGTVEAVSLGDCGHDHCSLRHSQSIKSMSVSSSQNLTSFVVPSKQDNTNNVFVLPTKACLSSSIPGFKCPQLRPVSDNHSMSIFNPWMDPRVDIEKSTKAAHSMAMMMTRGGQTHHPLLRSPLRRVSTAPSGVLGSGGPHSPVMSPSAPLSVPARHLARFRTQRQGLVFQGLVKRCSKTMLQLPAPMPSPPPGCGSGVVGRSCDSLRPYHKASLSASQELAMSGRDVILSYMVAGK